MADIRKLTTTIQPGGRIEVSAPDLPVGQQVEVTIEVSGRRGAARRSVLDVLDAYPGGLLFKTAAEVDNYLREERDSWDR